MKLTTVHQVLIASAAVLGGLFALRSALLFARGAGVRELAIALGAAALAVAAVLYLRRFRRRLHGP